MDSGLRRDHVLCKQLHREDAARAGVVEGREGSNGDSSCVTATGSLVAVLLAFLPGKQTFPDAKTRAGGRGVGWEGGGSQSCCRQSSSILVASKSI